MTFMIDVILILLVVLGWKLNTWYYEYKKDTESPRN